MPGPLGQDLGGFPDQSLNVAGPDMAGFDSNGLLLGEDNSNLVLYVPFDKFADATDYSNNPITPTFGGVAQSVIRGDGYFGPNDSGGTICEVVYNSPATNKKLSSPAGSAWTADMLFRWTAIPLLSNPANLLWLSNSGGTLQLQVFIHPTLGISVSNQSGTQFQFGSLIPMFPSNTWRHVAWVHKAGGGGRLYVNGILIYTNPSTSNPMAGGAGNFYAVGAHGSGAGVRNWLMDWQRIRLGEVYTSNFVPPTQKPRMRGFSGPDMGHTPP